MYIYLKSLLFILIFAASFGFILPSMISAASTELVLAGAVYASVVVPGLFLLAQSIHSDFKKFFSE